MLCKHSAKAWLELNMGCSMYYSLAGQRFYRAIIGATGFLIMSVAGALALAEPSIAEVRRVVVQTSGTMGTFGGREYLWANGFMEGTVERGDGTSGHYRVPVSLTYPDRDPNGFGFVDLVNSADFQIYDDESAPLGRRKIYYIGDVIFSDYLRREGFIYLSIQWSRMVTEILGNDYGVIENGVDGYEIIKDAARFLRHPITLEGATRFRPMAVDYAIAFGQSQSGDLLFQFAHRGDNRSEDGALFYNGMLAGVSAGCLALDNEDFKRPGPYFVVPSYYVTKVCENTPPADGKFISILSQTDVPSYLGYLLRGEAPHYRDYEIAGVSHMPPDMVPLSSIGAIRQNPVSFRPVFKATLRNLVEWITDDVEPPSSQYLDVTTDSKGAFIVSTDEDGNAIGGIRLPHMPSVLPDGESVGAPLGTYTGYDAAYTDPSDVYPAIGGAFVPFSEEELAARYPSNDVYVSRIEKAAAALLAERFILHEDYEAYVRMAKRGWQRSVADFAQGAN